MMLMMMMTMTMTITMMIWLPPQFFRNIFQDIVVSAIRIILNWNIPAE